MLLAIVSLTSCSNESKEVARRAKILEAEAEVAKLTTFISRYRTEFGESPSGSTSNADFMSQIDGANGDEAYYPRSSDEMGKALNDPWGNPYELELVKGSKQRWKMAVHSLGPDGVQSDDDIPPR